MSFIKFTHTSSNTSFVFRQYLSGQISKDDFAKTKIYYRSEDIAIYLEEEESLRHETWLKRVLNPCLRPLGWTIVSIFNNHIFKKYEFRRYPVNCKVFVKTVEQFYGKRD